MPTDEIDNFCETCGGSKGKKDALSLTQWVYACKCNDISEEPKKQPSCKRCGKPIETEGEMKSITQWFFNHRIVHARPMKMKALAKQITTTNQQRL